MLRPPVRQMVVKIVLVDFTPTCTTLSITSSNTSRQVRLS